MKIIIHLGAHCTDRDRLLKRLLSNADALSRNGMVVPGPSRYRGLLEQAAQKLKDRPASEEARQTILDAILGDSSADRMFLSFENFICVPGRVFEHGRLYNNIAHKPAWLRSLFSDHDVEFALAVCNPATFIPELLNHPKQTRTDLADLLQGADPLAIRWSEAIAALRQSNPDCPVTVWANEDTPFLWLQILREMADVGDDVRLMGGLDVVRRLMQPEGMKRLRAYLASHPPKTEIQRRRILSAFLDKYAIAEEVEEEIDLPGWTEDTVVELTGNYETDLGEIARLPGVNFIAP